MLKIFIKDIANIKIIYYNTKYQLVINFLVTITTWVIPVPIPNTEVKPNSAEDTCELPCWENRLLPVFLCLIY